MSLVVLRMFASAREAAGEGRRECQATTVADALAQARDRYGEGFATVLAGCRIWLNGEPTAGDEALVDGDEVAILPPVSGGAVPDAVRSERPRGAYLP